MADLSEEVEVALKGISRRSLGIAAFSTIVEWYDFTLYLYFATVLSRVFFGPGETSLMVTLGGFAVDYLMRCARSPEAMAGFGSPDSIEPLLRRVMNLPEESIEDYIAHSCHDDRFDCDLLTAIADANRRWGAQTGLGHAQAISDWLALTPIERAAALSQLRKVVLTEKDTLKVSGCRSTSTSTARMRGWAMPL